MAPKKLNLVESIQKAEIQKPEEIEALLKDLPEIEAFKTVHFKSKTQTTTSIYNMSNKLENNKVDL